MREAYARLLFREEATGTREEIRVQVQGGGFGTAILASCGMKPLLPPHGWHAELIDAAKEGAEGECWAQKFVPSESPISAYERLVRAALAGDSQHFVATPALLHSWKVWTSVIEALEPMEGRNEWHIVHRGACDSTFEPPQWDDPLYAYAREESAPLCSYAEFQRQLKCSQDFIMNEVDAMMHEEL